MMDLPATTCRLLLVRHATAEGNGRFQGQRDVSLTSAGRRELRLLGEKCSQHPIRAVYSSDLRRARQTANAVAGKIGLRVEVRPELREMHFGEWEGLSWNQIARRFPRLASLWMERFPHQAIPGAEPLSQFKKRIAAGVREVVAANRGQCALIVTHAGVIRFTLGKVLGLPARNLFRLAQDSCALNIIDYLESGAIVRCING
ncbi:MAG: histidine phosphatase family protein [Terriglobia bacterium]|jgi:broad specificity phosphatase PhoE